MRKDCIFDRCGDLLVAPGSVRALLRQRRASKELDHVGIHRVHGLLPLAQQEHGHRGGLDTERLSDLDWFDAVKPHLDDDLAVPVGHLKPLRARARARGSGTGKGSDRPGFFVLSLELRLVFDFALDGSHVVVRGDRIGDGGSRACDGRRWERRRDQSVVYRNGLCGSGTLGRVEERCASQEYHHQDWRGNEETDEAYYKAERERGCDAH